MKNRYFSNNSNNNIFSFSWSSHREMFCDKDVLKNRSMNLLKRDSSTGVGPCFFTEYLRETVYSFWVINYVLVEWIEYTDNSPHLSKTSLNEKHIIGLYLKADLQRYSENMQQIYRRQSCWRVISLKLLCNFIEISLRYWYSAVNLVHIFRTLSCKNAHGALLLNVCEHF